MQTSNQSTIPIGCVLRGIAVEEPTWTSVRILRFIVANIGQDVVLISKMWLEILDIEACNTLKITRAGAPIVYYNYNVELETLTKEYVLNENEFAYDPDTRDGFNIELSSKEYVTYTMRVNIEWQNMKDGNPQLINSDTYRVSFPINNTNDALDNIRQRKKYKYTNPHPGTVPPTLQVNTGGGSYIAGNVNTGDFTGRDKYSHTKDVNFDE